MAAPTPTTRATPAGRKLKNGYRALITIGRDPDISFWEIEVTPPGLQAGPPIDQTTMHNESYITKAPDDLLEVTDGAGKAAYDPAVESQLLECIGVETVLTYRYRDGTTKAVYGWLQSFVPDPLVRGQMPTAAFTTVHSNYDSANNVEAGPAVASVSGT